MSLQNREAMDEYLQSTEMCDCDNKTLREKAKDIVSGSLTQKESALRLFYFVRDQIMFGMDYPDVRASRTLSKKIGFCLTKTNLQIALLRAINIPARCHYVHLPKEQVKDITPGFMYSRMPAVIGHSWCECYLANRWIACEAIMDKSLYEADLKMGFFTKQQVPTIDWDGENDLILFKPWFIKDIGTFSNLKDAMIESNKRGESLLPSNRLFGWIIYFLINRNISNFRKSYKMDG